MSIPAPVPAIDKIWFIGDEFTSRSFESYFKDRPGSSNPADSDCYCASNFDVSSFYANKFTSNNPNMVSRVINQMHKAITDEKLFPKWVVIVLDDDLIRYINEEGKNLTESMEKLINYIMIEHNKYVAAQKDYLLKKSKRPGIPGIIWIEAPNHMSFPNNEERDQFNKALATIAPLHKNVHALQLKKIWEETNTNLYLEEQRRFTAQGWRRYWSAVDKMVRYADTIFIKKLQRKEKEQHNYSSSKHHDYDRYHWSRYEEDRCRSPSVRRRRLPTPK